MMVRNTYFYITLLGDVIAYPCPTQKVGLDNLRKKTPLDALSDPEIIALLYQYIFLLLLLCAIQIQLNSNVYLRNNYSKPVLHYLESTAGVPANNILLSPTAATQIPIYCLNGYSPSIAGGVYT